MQLNDGRRPSNYAPVRVVIFSNGLYPDGREVLHTLPAGFRCPLQLQTAARAPIVMVLLHRDWLKQLKSLQANCCTT